MADRYNIVCDQGSTFRRVFTLKNSDDTLVDLTGYSARMQVREAFDSETTLASITDPDVAEPSDPDSDGTIVLGGDLGTINATIHESVTTAIPAGKFRWDIEIISPSGEITRILDGTFKVKAEVTR